MMLSSGTARHKKTCLRGHDSEQSPRTPENPLFSAGSMVGHPAQKHMVFFLKWVYATGVGVRGLMRQYAK